MKKLAKKLNKLDRQLDKLERTVNWWGFMVDLVLAGAPTEEEDHGESTGSLFLDLEELFPVGEGYSHLDDLTGSGDLGVAGEWLPDVFQIWEEGNFLGEYSETDLALAAVKNLGQAGEGLVLLGVDFYGRSQMVAAGKELVALAGSWPREREAMLQIGRAILSAGRAELREAFAAD